MSASLHAEHVTENVRGDVTAVFFLQFTSHLDKSSTVRTQQQDLCVKPRNLITFMLFLMSVYIVCKATKSDLIHTMPRVNLYKGHQQYVAFYTKFELPFPSLAHPLSICRIFFNATIQKTFTIRHLYLCHHSSEHRNIWRKIVFL